MFSHVQIKYEWINNIIWTPSAPIGISDKSVLLNHASYRKKISWISVWKNIIPIFIFLPKKNTREFYGEHYSQLATKFIDWSWRYLMKKDVFNNCRIWYSLHQDVLGIWLVIVYDNQKVDKCLIFGTYSCSQNLVTCY